MLGRKPRGSVTGAAAAPVVAEPAEPADPVIVAVDVAAPADEVRRWFLDASRWTRFQGQHAWIDPVPGGRLRVEMAPGVFTAGTFEEIGERRLVFTWGREGDPSMPEGSTTVTIRLEETGPLSTRIELVHQHLADRSLAEEHEGGWRYHLVRLGVAASGVTEDAEVVDLFLGATAEPNAIARRGLLERTCATNVEVADSHDDTTGITSLVSKLDRLAGETPPVQLVRVGDVQRIGALLRCEYAVRGEPDEELGRGLLVASIDHSRHLQAVSLFG